MERSGGYRAPVRPAAGSAPSRVARAAAFLYLWGTLGFAIGTLTLLGPVRWVTAALRARGAAQAAEDWAVRGIIVLLVLVTGSLAWVLSRRVAAAAGWRRVVVPGVTTLLAVGALGLWLNPRLVAGAAQVEAAGGRFVFGPYPLREDLARLKAQGFDGVITLLHPAVAPFEPKLLADERDAARQVGIRLVEAPMLPWISGNEASLETVRRLARDGDGRYYVHCYLGKDRVNVVRRLVSQVTGAALDADNTGARRLGRRPELERGKLYHLGDSVYAGPYPTDVEWISYILNGSVRGVVSLLSDGVPDDSQWIAHELALGRQYDLAITRAPLRSYPWNPSAALVAARRVRGMERPVFVHAFRSDRPRLEGFVQAYRSGLPPLPPSVFEPAMTGGAVQVVGPNVAVGPRPTGPEFGAYLQTRGVAGIVYLGEPDDAAVREDRPVATSVLLTYRVMRASDHQLRRMLSRGGPWYLYGPQLDAARPALDRWFDPGL